MIGGRDQARFKSDFYRISYHKMLNALIVSSIIILLLIAAIIYLILVQPAPNYYATTTNGLVIPMRPVTR